MVLLGGTRFETAPKTGRNWNDGTTEPKPSSGSDVARNSQVKGMTEAGNPVSRPSSSGLGRGSRRGRGIGRGDGSWVEMHHCVFELDLVRE